MSAFSLIESILRRKQVREAYRRKFGALNDNDAMIVLVDLARFCHATKSANLFARGTGQMDPLALAWAEGKREVFNRLLEQSRLTDADLDAALQRIYEKEADYAA